MMAELHHILHIIWMLECIAWGGLPSLAIMSVYKTVFRFCFTKLAFHFVSDS